MPRFVILRHADYPGRPDHYDLLLEHEDALLTWELPSSDLSASQPALQKPDHRAVYLEYEGAISGGRGFVHRVESGTFEWIEKRPDRCVIRWTGAGLSGSFELIRLRDEQWRLEPWGSSLKSG